jgi:hypothetical protein
MALTAAVVVRSDGRERPIEIDTRAAGCLTPPAQEERR